MFSARLALALSAARRINHLNYWHINLLRAYLNANSCRADSPNLVAKTSYSFELTHTYHQKFSTAPAYACTTQPIVNVVQPSPNSGSLVVNRDVNLSTQNFFTLTKW